MRKIFALILTTGLTLTGCGAIESYAKQKVVDDLKADVEQRLEQHDLSIAQVTSVLADPDGKITKGSVATVIKDSTEGLVLVEGKKILDAKLAALASKTDVTTESGKLWNWVLGALGTLVSAYMGKQLVSWRKRAQTDKAFHDRIVALEKITGVDLGVKVARPKVDPDLPARAARHAVGGCRDSQPTSTPSVDRDPDDDGQGPRLN